MSLLSMLLGAGLFGAAMIIAVLLRAVRMQKEALEASYKAQEDLQIAGRKRDKNAPTIWTFDKDGLVEFATTVKNTAIASLVEDELVDPKEAVLWCASHIMLLRKAEQIDPMFSKYFVCPEGSNEKHLIHTATVKNLSLTKAGNNIVAEMNGEEPEPEATVTPFRVIETEETDDEDD